MGKSLHKMVQLDVGKLLDDTGHILSLADLTDILALNDLAWRYTDISIDECSDILATPHKLGNVLLYPMTLGAAIWIEENVSKWFEKDPLLANLAVAYALSVAREPHALSEIANRGDCMKAIKHFWRRCGAGVRELETILSRILKGAESSEEDESYDLSIYGAVIASLCEIYGQSPEYWLWEESLDRITTLMAAQEKKQVAEWKSIKSNSQPGAKISVPECVKSRFKAYIDRRKEVQAKWQM